MNVRPLRWALLLSATISLLLVTGCSTVSTRIEQNRGAYNSLPASDRALVAKGKLREGMGASAVLIAWGKPDQKSVGSAHGKHGETWIYLAYRDAYPPYPYGGAYIGGGGFYGGGGYARVGFHRHGRRFYYAEPFYDPFYYAPVTQVPYPYKTVSFQNGRVVAYQSLYPPR